MLVFPLVLFGALLLVPFVSNRGERAPSRRPVAVLVVIVIYTVVGVLTYEGVVAPWSPEMTAWSGDPMPDARSSSAARRSSCKGRRCFKTRTAAIAMRSTGSAAGADPI